MTSGGNFRLLLLASIYVGGISGIPSDRNHSDHETTNRSSTLRLPEGNSSKVLDRSIKIVNETSNRSRWTSKNRPRMVISDLERRKYNRPKAPVPITMVEVLRKARLDLFKRQLLSKLKMKDRPDPALVAKIKLPIPIIKGYVMEPRQKVKQIVKNVKERMILLPDYCRTACKTINKDPSGCIFFRMKKSFPPGQLSSAILWVYKRADLKDGSGNQTFAVSDLKQPSGSIGNFTTRRVESIHQTQFIKGGWIQMDVKGLVRKWLNKPHLLHGVDVSCKTCEMSSNRSPIALNGAYRPFLMIRSDRQVLNPVSRKRRGLKKTRCSKSSKSCCIHPFKVTVAELGWDDWIVQPETFEVNECRGSCDQTVWMPGISVRASVLRFYDYMSCCSVSKMGSISLLYYNENGTVVENTEIRMVAEDCQCS